MGKASEKFEANANNKLAAIGNGVEIQTQGRIKVYFIYQMEERFLHAREAAIAQGTPLPDPKPGRVVPMINRMYLVAECKGSTSPSSDHIVISTMADQHSSQNIAVHSLDSV
eukprot:TRINITY_DN4720_c0_g1_i2.p3 TRINITY_DN4720_c0_g1~~TRINITY_DN4720_c0_g1_i2.p3  ORF type:complete len:112 (+),score=26.56 TRINITY_DN4720_c0_g1_i2:495-830(+)